jgi:hypothetical protein
MVQGTEESKVQDLDALIDQIHMHLKYNSCKENLRETFQMYDKDESGYVDRETFFKICETLNVPVDDSLIKEVSVDCGQCGLWFGLIAQAEDCSFLPTELKESDLLVHSDDGISHVTGSTSFSYCCSGSLLRWGWGQMAEKLLD